MTTVHHPYDTRIFHKECTSLQKGGYDVSLIASMDKQEIQKDTDVTMVPIKKRKNRLARMVFSMLEAYLKAKSLKSDCYHILEQELLLVVGVLKKKDNDVINDVHEYYLSEFYVK